MYFMCCQEARFSKEIFKDILNKKLTTIQAHCCKIQTLTPLMCKFRNISLLRTSKEICQSQPNCGLQNADVNKELDCTQNIEFHTFHSRVVV